MNMIKFRGCPLWLLVTSTLLSLLFVGFSVYAFTLMFQSPVLRIPIQIAYLILFFAGIFLFVQSLVEYHTIIQICDEKVTIIHPFGKKITLSFNSITYWGCASRMARSSYLYFMSINERELLDYLHNHWKSCYRIFGRECVESAKCSDMGLLQLAIGTYIFNTPSSKRHNVYLAPLTSPQNLKAVVKVMGRDAIITGPWVMPFEEWQTAAKYHPEEL